MNIENIIYEAELARLIEEEKNIITVHGKPVQRTWDKKEQYARNLAKRAIQTTPVKAIVDYQNKSLWRKVLACINKFFCLK